jgi:hypothetical protein
LLHEIKDATDAFVSAWFNGGQSELALGKEALAHKKEVAGTWVVPYKTAINGLDRDRNPTELKSLILLIYEIFVRRTSRASFKKRWDEVYASEKLRAAARRRGRR